MNRYLLNIINLGLHKNLSVEERRNIKLVNSFILLSTFIGLGLVVVDSAYMIWSEAIAAFLAIVLIFIPSLVLNKIKKYDTARFYYFVGTSLLILAIVIIALSEGRSTGTENILFAVGVGVMVLFESKRKLVLFGLIFLELLTIAFLKHFAFDLPNYNNFGLLVVNYSIVFIAIYFFYDRYKSEFSRSHYKVLSLNEQLSEQKEKVTQAQHMLYSMIDHLPLIIFMIDRNGRFTSMNGLFASDFGFDIKSMIGEKYTEALPERFLNKYGSYFHKSLIEGERVDFDELLELPNQDAVPAYGSFVPVKDHAGEVTAVTFFAANVSEIKEKEQELEILNETKNKLFSIIAHDLRNPLNLLNGLVFLSKEKGLSTEDRKNQTEKIEKHLKALTVMLDNLLIWARGQIEGRPSELEILNINDIINQETRVYKEMVDAKKINLSINQASNQIVKTDETSLRMIVRNIFTNAIKFTPHLGEIHIDTWDDDGDVFIKIKDTGLGMPIELVEKIKSGTFIDSSEGTSGEKGAGIGLFLGLEMLKENGGRFTLNSEEGIGTEFIVSVPSAKEEELLLDIQ